jgi:hypothetical protein
MDSKRFSLPIMITDHARGRMKERGVDDNLLCVAVVLEKTLFVKTLMHHFTWNPQS